MNVCGHIIFFIVLIIVCIGVCHVIKLYYKISTN